MVYLIDTNVIIRFLVGDHPRHFEETKRIFQQIERAKIEVEILETVLMEALFVLEKFYSLPRGEVVEDLKAILALKGVVNAQKLIFFEALSIYASRSIDFVDALICARCKLQAYRSLSFDGDLKRC